MGQEGPEAWEEEDQADPEALDSPAARVPLVARASEGVQAGGWDGHRSAGPGKKLGARISGSGATTRCPISAVDEDELSELF